MKRKFNQIRRIVQGALPSDRAKIDFIVGGVQKGGTTALDYYLRAHPDICLAETKEVHFFDNDNIFRYPKVLRECWYRSFFRECSNGALKGEVTPIYIFWPESVRRIYEYNPETKLIFIFRDPVARAYSHWNMEVKRGNETRLFAECIRAYVGSDCADCKEDRVFSYVNRGFYAKQIEEVFRYFRKDQVLCVKQEDLQENPRAVLDSIARHLEVSPFCTVNAKRVHALSYDAEISPDDVEYLRKVYHDDNARFERITGLDTTQWRTHSVL